MCGLAGFFDSRLERPAAEVQLRRMLARLTHRGPDDEGEWHEGPLAIGHRRLAIVDLSPLGHQPMASANGRFVIAFNGEIYNHFELRQQLAIEGTLFRGHSDTEVLLGLIERKGLAGALRLCIGMFAIVLWDRHESVLHLARDRFGEKPLYFGWSRGAFLFGSELKALKASSSFDSSVDPETVERVLQRGYVPPTKSIYRAFGQVPPGTCISIALSVPTSNSSAEQKLERFWDPLEQSEVGRQKPFSGSVDNAVDALEGHLRQAVALQLQADVPVGALLSGGVDSSITTALMCALAPARVRSYSIGFHRNDLNEAEYAKAVATYLGTDHTEWYVDESEALSVVPELSGIYDEPLADASQIPTLILARLVRQDVTVALSGDGADEIFGGYPKYLRGLNTWETPGRRSMRTLAGFLDRHVAGSLKRMLPAELSRSIPWHRLDTAALLYGSASPAEMAERVGTLNHHASEYVSKHLVPAARLEFDDAQMDPHLSYRRMAMLADVRGFLPGDILTKVDRATMAASLESRAPFLDHRIFAFAASLPESFLFDVHGGKSILRKLLYRLVPRHLVDRPKAGFSAPLGDWLRTSLKVWAYDVLDSRAASEVLAVEKCRALLALHCEGHHDLSARLWPMLSVAAWAQRAQSTLG
jgi:asparagine synthase (glutamine-hydrolysing)